ncbi:GNAT family N-acetyltransferase [Nonomuraea terrae]|nr:GNAT family N-acetyltransferase [Nonomuraea terrae]
MREDGRPPQRLLVEPLPEQAAEDAALMSTLADLVNAVYADSEKGLWREGAARTSAAELAEFTRAGQIAVARLDGRAVGCVRVQRLSDELGEFGMLAAAPEHRGIGAGRELVRFAEERARAEGRRVMQLELLAPQTWSHPSKEFLADWYGRLGYRMVSVGDVAESYPELAPLLATACDFRVYHKSLA